ncbi:MAG: Crp/Fnr family transcriptional regulator [Paraglaciecola sp.]|nr:Crp/Fnr family transcriptional regulator [Paraglaciecola sp.]
MNIMHKSLVSIEQHTFSDNRLFAALCQDSFLNLLPHLSAVDIKRGESLCGCLNHAQYVYFPTTCMISLIYDLEDGLSTEVAVIGNEGLVGSSLLMGGDYSYCRTIAQTSGGAFRIKLSVLQREFDKGTELQQLLLLYIQAQITQISQTAVCNRHHSIEQQFCRWLLLSLDRSSSTHLHMTQEQIAHNLGVRRESVTDAARALLAENLIQYARGVISVLDRPRLEARVCECYSVVKNEYDRLLPQRVR